MAEPLYNKLVVCPNCGQETPNYEDCVLCGNSLEDPAWCSVRVMVKRKDVIGVMERLETLGASAILETKIVNCRL